MNRSNSQCGPGLGSYLKYLNLKYLAILFVLMAGLPFLASAQDATIIGTVTDPAGAVVPNVTVTITNSETGRVRVVTTNSDGQFAAPSLPIGHFDVKAEVTGFKVEERSGIVLNVSDRARVDFQLRLGTTAESVSVEANPIAVQADTGAISTLVSGQQMTQLATNGRSIYSLINLTTGAASLQGDFQTPTPVGGNGMVSFNGNRPGHNIYLLDGGENLDRGGSGTFSVMPSMDAFAEAQTLTSNYSAQYGLSSGATVTTVLRSGSRDFHASAWEFVRNNALDARNFFNPAPQSVAKLNYNTYGFNVGGPVTFGKLYNENRTKTFFFYNMEWRSLIQGGLLNQTVPDTATYGGDFGATTIMVPTTTQVAPNLIAANCPGGVLPAGVVQGSPFPNNTIPTCMLNANAQSLLNAGGKYGGIFPANNGLSNGNPAFQGGNNTPTNVREEIVRIDENATDKFTIFGHFIAEQINQGFGTSMWIGDNVPSANNNFGNPSYSGVVHTAYVISPTLVNEVAFNYNGNRIAITPAGLSTAPADFTFGRYFTGPNTLDRIPNINLAGTTGANFQIGWEPWNNKADDYQIRDDVSWTKGKHQIKMGGSWALYKKIQDLFTQTQGQFQFNGEYTGNDFADYLLGFTQQYSEAGVQDSGHWNNVSWAGYVEDNWRVNNRLTLNLGLRWDGIPHTYEANNRMSNFYPNLYNPANAAVFTDPTNPNTISPLSPGLGTSPNPILTGSYYLNGIGISGQNGVSKNLVNNTWDAFGPRLGFAYDLTGAGKTVIRGGFGIMYERVQGNDMYNAGPNPPFSASVTFNGVSLSNPTEQLNGLPITVGIPVSGITGLDKSNYDVPTSYQYSLGVQHSIGTAVISASYVGSQNRHQNFTQQIDLPDQSLLPSLVATPGPYNALLNYPGYNSIVLSRDEANGDYNSLQLSMRGNIKSDLTYQFGYTYSHANDSTTSTGSGSDLDGISNPYAGWKYDMGPSIYDRHHVFFASYVYQIPLLKNSDNKLLKTTLGGWEISGIVSAESGAPLNIGLTGGVPGNVCSGSTVQSCTNRPDYTNAGSDPHTVGEWFNTADFTAPAPGTWGNMPHNIIRGPGRDNWNMSLIKNFVFSESRGSNLQFRAEFYNVWNHTQFEGDYGNGGISTNLGSSNFGAITNAYDPRTIQLALKLTF